MYFTRPDVKLKLSDLDSNQDKQYQKLSYYPYTIGQKQFEDISLDWECKCRQVILNMQERFKKKLKIFCAQFSFKKIVRHVQHFHFITDFIG